MPDIIHRYDGRGTLLQRRRLRRATPPFGAPTATLVATDMAVCHMMPNLASATALTMRDGVRVFLRLPGGFNLPSRIKAQENQRLTGGVNLPSRIGVLSIQRMPGGVNLPSRIGAQVKSRVPGGAIIASIVKAIVSLRVPGGANLPARILNAVRLRAPGGKILYGARARVQANAASVPTVETKVPGPRRPLFLIVGPSYWPGRSS